MLETKPVLFFCLRDLAVLLDFVQSVQTGDAEMYVQHSLREPDVRLKMFGKHPCQKAGVALGKSHIRN